MLVITAMLMLPAFASADEIDGSKTVDTIIKINAEEKAAESKDETSELSTVDSESDRTGEAGLEAEALVDKQDADTQDAKEEVQEEEIDEEDSIVKIERPLEKNSATTDEKVLITGKGPKGLTVELYVYKKQLDEDKKPFYEETYKESFEIGEMGRFIKTIELDEGENQIVISAYDEEKQEQVSLKRNIKYTKEDVDTTKKKIEEIKDKAFTDVVDQTISSVK